MRKEWASIAGMAAMLILSIGFALALAPVFFALQFQAFANANDPLNPILYVILILVFTAVILLLFRYRRGALAKYIILGSIFLTVAFVFIVPLYLALWPISDDLLRSDLATVGAFLLAVVIVYALHKYPEWYLVDTVGIAIASGVTAILGISFSILPSFILLSILAGYDAWAVYRSKHMVTLADEMTSQKLPILLVVPKKAKYSYIEQKSLKEQIDSGEEREAMFMGLGDIIVPGTLVVSAYIFLGAPNWGDVRSVLGLPSNLFIALCTLIGILVGFAFLMRFVVKGNPQAGLPFLNGGALAGYLVSFAAVYGTLYRFALF